MTLAKEGKDKEEIRPAGESWLDDVKSANQKVAEEFIDKLEDIMEKKDGLQEVMTGMGTYMVEQVKDSVNDKANSDIEIETKQVTLKQSDATVTITGNPALLGAFGTRKDIREGIVFRTGDDIMLIARAVQTKLDVEKDSKVRGSE